MSAPVLRPYQLAAIDELRHSLSTGHRRPMLQMATGGGKTTLTAEVIKRTEAKGNRTLFICDSTALVDQALDTFDNYGGINCGVMQADHIRTDESCLTQVCTAQTLIKRIKRFRNEFENYPVAMIWIDEAHVQYSELRELLVMIYPKAPIIGLSATPFSLGLGNFYDDVFSAVSMRQLTNEGYLLPYEVYAPFVPSMKGVKTTSGDYDAGKAAELYEGQIVADIVSTWQRLGENRSTLVFACNVAHSKFISEAFQAAGVHAEHIDGYGGSDQERAERKDKIARYKSGELKMLVSVAILTKGFDAPITGCVVIARPTKSLIMHMQIHGRLVRIFEGIDKGIVLDHAGNFVRLGDPADITDFSLNDGSMTVDSMNKTRKDEAEPLPVPCSACQKLKPSGTFKCPHCGHEPTKEHKVVNVEGELVLLSDTQPKKLHDDKDIQRWYSELLLHCENKGYKPGWAYNKCVDKFGNEFKDLRPEAYAAKGLSFDVKNYIKYQNIKYARGRAKGKQAIGNLRKELG